MSKVPPTVVMTSLLLVTFLPISGLAQPAPGQAQLYYLEEIKARYLQLQPVDMTAVEAAYQTNYDLVAQMQGDSDRADVDFLRSYSPNLAGFLLEENVKVHALMATAAARIGYQELYDRHLDVALSRIRRHGGFRAQMAEEALEEILRNETLNGTDLRQEFCAWAAADFCGGATPTFYQSYLAGAGNPIELVFDRSRNMYDLSEFDVAVTDPEASPQSRFFANALSNQLRRPIVTNWFIALYLDEVVQPAALRTPQPGQAQVFAQRGRINIEPHDFFIVDPADLEKQRWLVHVEARYAEEQRVSMTMRIPDGEYHFFRRNQPPDPDARPNLKIARMVQEAPSLIEVLMRDSGRAVDVRTTLPVDDRSLWVRFLQPDFKLLRADLGTGSKNSGLDGGGEVRLFHRFHRNFALQTQLQGVFRRQQDTLDLGDLPRFVNRDQRDFGDFTSNEFQFDVGPVFRFGNIQLAALQSLRRVDRDDWDNAGTVGHFFFNVGYIFGRGQVGGYVTRANKDEPVVRTVQFDQVLFEETYLSVLDQVGVNFDVQLTPNTSVEGAFGYLDSARRDDMPGGVVRFNLPPWRKLRFTAEFGYNESFVAPEDSWRFGFGVRLGEWGTGNAPSTYLGEERNGPVPVYVPRVRYETLTRVVRRGNRRPIADAGPDKLDLIPERLPDGRLGRRVQLDGTGSHDPDGDTIRFERPGDPPLPGWVKLMDCDPSIELEGASTPTPSFVIGNGQKCSIELVVTDSFGLDSEPDVVVVSTIRVDEPMIVEFRAEPAEIRVGETSMLIYEVKGHDSLTITNVPSPVPESPFPVMPNETTTYVLTACNAINECVSAEATVRVRPPIPVIEDFRAEPAEIRRGDKAFLSWKVDPGASTVVPALDNRETITQAPDPLPLVCDKCVEVKPDDTVTYTLTVTNNRGEFVSAQATVLVRPAIPVIEDFRVEPAEIRWGEKAWLSWKVTPDDGTVSLTLDNLPPGAPDPLPLDCDKCVEVMPDDTVTYTLTATNNRGEFVSAQATVLVRPPIPVIEDFRAEPAEIRVGEKSRLSWNVDSGHGTVVIALDNQQTITSAPDPLPLVCDMCVEVMPGDTVIYTLTATNNRGEFVSAQATVLVRPAIPVIEDFRAEPAEIRLGETSRLSWKVDPGDSTIVIALDNLQTVISAPNPLPLDCDMCVEVKPDDTVTYTLTATNDRGEFVSSQATVLVRPPIPVIESFMADPPEIRTGGESTLRWRVVDPLFPMDPDQSGVIVKIDAPESGGMDLPLEGTLPVTPDKTTTYTLTATNNRGEFVSAEATVTVTPPPPEITEFRVEPSDLELRPDQDSRTVILSWCTNHATRVVFTNAENADPPISPDDVCNPGGVSIPVSQTTTFALTAFNDLGESVQSFATVNVIKLNQPQIIEFTASSLSITAGDTVTLGWVTQDTEYVRIIPDNGEATPPLDANGSLEVMPTETTIYTLLAFDKFGSIGDTATVTVEVTP